MNANAFEKLFRKVVREEIDYALRREIKSLKEDLRDEFKSTIVEQPTQRTLIPKNVQSSLKERILAPVEQQMPTEVANVVNKDYRELMRAIDKKKNNRP